MTKRSLIPILVFCLTGISCAVDDRAETRDAGPLVVVAVPEEAVVATAETEREYSEVGVPLLMMQSNINERQPHDLTPLEDAIVDRAMKCDRSRTTPDRALLEDMLLYERNFGVPDAMRGMVLAAACHESGLNPDAEGDHKFSKRGRSKAIGILQQWAWWEGPVYRIDRRDPRQAARAWIAHVHRQIEKVRKPCGLTQDHQRESLWRVAWVTAVYAPKKDPRCFFKRREHRHFKRLKKWRETWEHLLSADGDQIASR